MQSGVYEIFNTANGHRYIGSSADIHCRWLSHKNDLYNNRHKNSYLLRAWDLYGEDQFAFKLIEECAPELLIDREQFYIDELKPEYNIRKIADRNIGVRHSAEARAKMSLARIGNKYSIGHKHSEETRAKMSAAGKGKTLSAEHRAKIGAAQIGKKVISPSAETRAKLSAAGKGRIFSEEHKARIATALKGNKNTLGYKQSKITRALMSAAQKLRWSKVREQKELSI